MTAIPPRARPRRIVVLVLSIVVVILVAGAVVVGFFAAASPDASVTTAVETPTPTAIPSMPSPTPTPVDTGFSENTEVYDTSSLQTVDVFSVNPALPRDDDPFGESTGLVAQPVAAGAAVFADPTAGPVAFLPQTQTFEGTIVPVIEEQDHWVKVLLVGRAGVPPEASSAQTVGWLRAADVALAPVDTHVEVSLSARTIDIVSDAGSERIATDFGSGTAETPTPTGRMFIMMTRTVPEFGYTRGHPLVYLSAQSPTLAGFADASVAITAFHYHDARSGTISNGCLRLAPEAIDRLAQLRPGTLVVVSA
ncbi:lipoprotein-anchoring transpeptidase ErfK/SrfK [Microbacterium halimionae]|uniref:Lipoprotein-anchoring transpeptidase ErfK/SrfK n=1 Tax=Microbacterium halimionae TaxID=1526413 RepID=A0A7W3PL99_9MICO|nr:L,D-transpeptidase [Microbacterium halimionae]MBA8816345.1 lipoprotein-anchoring transpeptidase ErfK/SrfK [Microbacterium halimionae]NII96547.1 lipoprotein-anchoring transpeptidase ErfK/SrfK [Microbacterium halimionae]